MLHIQIRDFGVSDMKLQRGLGLYLGRSVLAIFFLWTSLYKLFWWFDVESHITGDICNWHLFASKITWLENATESLLPLVPLLHSMAIVLSFAGALMLILSWHVKIGASLLVIYTFCDTVFTHYFWMLDGAGRLMELTMFMQNISILGGLILVLAEGKRAQDKVRRFAPIPIMSESEEGD
jgi:uncharacterized membrane protein YphA (DoxX/SURF4 family)